MWLSALYLLANVVVVVLLLRLRYHRSWRFLCAMLAANCWQIVVRLAVPLSDGHIPVETRRLLAIHWWLPGETILMGLTIAAIIEALWRSLAGIPDRHTVGVVLSLAGGWVFTGSFAGWVLGIPRYSDWYKQLLADQVVVNLCIASAALIAFGLAETFHRRHDPRYVRMHCGLFATLACGHVLLSDMTHWAHNHELFRALECACLFGWLVNADLLRRESAPVAAALPASPSIAKSPVLPLPLPHASSNQSRFGTRAVPAALGCRGYQEASRVAAWPLLPPDAHAGM